MYYLVIAQFILILQSVFCFIRSIAQLMWCNCEHLKIFRAWKRKWTNTTQRVTHVISNNWLMVCSLFSSKLYLVIATILLFLTIINNYHLSIFISLSCCINIFNVGCYLQQPVSRTVNLEDLVGAWPV